MSLTREVTVWCDANADKNDPFRCGKWLTGHDAARTRSEAKALGWKVALPGGRDLCPEHAAEPQP